MRVEELELKDWRGFREAKLDLRGLDTVVLAGPNGCGKSSALEALAVLFETVPFEIAGERANRAYPSRHGAIRSGADAATCRFTFSLGGAELFGAHWMPRESSAERPPIRKPSIWASLAKWSEALAAGTFTGELPVLVHLHSDSTRPRPDGDAAPWTGRLAAYAGAFDQEASHFESFERWFEQEENLENEERVHRRDLSWQRPTLRAARAAITTFLGGLRAERLGELRVLRAHVNGPLSEVRGRLTVAKDGLALFLDQLSAGERRLVLLAGDVARRMAILNPDLPDPTTSPGVILVDEIDLHLHPAWARRVMPAARAAFPNVQLIVTSHSPQVLASVPSASVVLMRDFSFLPGPHRVHGRDANTLLRTVFDVPERPDDVMEALDAVYAALDDDPALAAERFAQLRLLLEEDDPELARIETLLALAGD
jgi:predicted ATP-binding protein involved in virulence